MTQTVDQQNIFKKYFLLLLRLLPILILILILLYLGHSNISSEVYLDVKTKAFTFSNTEDVEALISKLAVDSVQLVDCNLHFRAKQIMDMKNIDIAAVVRDRGIGGDIFIKNNGSMLFKDLSVPKDSDIYLERDGNSIDLRVNLVLDSLGSQPESSIHGEIYVGDSFTFTTQNIQIRGLEEQNIEHIPVEVLTSRRSRNITFESRHSAKIKLFINKKIMKDFDDILRDKFINNISFIITDETKRKNKEMSTVLAADVEIAGTDFFGKQFLLKKHRVEKSDFLLIPNSDEYYVDGVYLDKAEFLVEISCEEAHDLRTGRRVRLLYSVFPSFLDFIMAEPSKKTIWTILLFIITQTTALRGFLKKQLEKIKSPTSTN